MERAEATIKCRAKSCNVLKCTFCPAKCLQCYSAPRPGKDPLAEIRIRGKGIGGADCSLAAKWKSRKSNIHEHVCFHQPFSVSRIWSLRDIFVLFCFQIGMLCRFTFDLLVFALQHRESLFEHGIFFLASVFQQTFFDPKLFGTLQSVPGFFMEASGHDT